MDMIYLDNNATTQPSPQVREAMLPFFDRYYANPSSMHRPGQQARAAVDEARGKVAGMMGCGTGELVFTSGGTESINMAIRGLLALRRPRNRVVISAVEHSATWELCQQLSRDGVEVVEVGVDSAGRLDMEQLKKTVEDKTALVSIMWANNETGAIFPVEEISAICRAREVPFHCDGTQVMGRLPVDVKKAGMDAMSFSGHKFHGPKGVGGLFIRRGLFLQPLILGGTQENNRRGGTENVAGIVGLGRAAELAVSSLLEMDRVGNLRNRLERGVLARIPGAVINAGGGPRVANTSNIAFARLEADAIVLLLSERGLCVSAGAACSSGSLEPSRVLLNMGINRPLAHGSIRFSLSRYTTAEEIDLAIEMVARAVERLGKILPG